MRRPFCIDSMANINGNSLFGYISKVMNGFES
jgi:hypothetical protein